MSVEAVGRIFPLFYVNLVRLRIQILRQSLISEWIGRTIRTVRSLKTPDTLTTRSTSLAQVIPTVCDAPWTSLIRFEAEKRGFPDFLVSRICRVFLCARVVRHKNHSERSASRVELLLYFLVSTGVRSGGIHDTSLQHNTKCDLHVILSCSTTTFQRIC